MTNIVLLGRKSDKRLSNLFIHSLSKRCRIADISESNVIQSFAELDFLLWHSSSLREIKTSNTALLFKDFLQSPIHTSFALDTVAIVDAQNEAAVESVAKSRLKALTCGLGARDTITLSSFTPDSAVVSLQRTIKAFSGAEIEPFEVPVKLTRKLESYSILSVCAVLLLSGRADLLEGLSL